MDSEDEDDRYKSLQSAAALTSGMGILLQVVGGGALILTYIIGISLNAMWRVPLTEILIVCGIVVVAGLVLLFGGWRLRISADLTTLQIDMANDMQRAAIAVEKLREDARALKGKQDLLLMAISSSSARTAAAVEVLAATVRRPPPAA